MAKLSIEYGKTKKDGSRAVMIRLVSGKTQKHIPTQVTLCKGDYREYPDGRIKVLNNNNPRINKNRHTKHGYLYNGGCGYP